MWATSHSKHIFSAKESNTKMFMLNKKNGTLCAILLKSACCSCNKATHRICVLHLTQTRMQEGMTVIFQAPMQPCCSRHNAGGDAGAGPADMLATDGSEAAAASSSASSSMLPTFPSKVCIVRCIVSSLLGSCVQPICSSVAALGTSVLHR